MAAARPLSPLSHSLDFPETFDYRRSSYLSASATSVQHMPPPSPDDPLCNLPVSIAISVSSYVIPELFNSHSSDIFPLSPAGVWCVVPLSLAGSLRNQPAASTVDTHNLEVAGCTSFTNCTGYLSHHCMLDELLAKHAHRSCTVSPCSHHTPIPISPSMPDPPVSA